MSEESWRLVWFPPNVAEKSRTFGSVDGVVKFLKKQADDDGEIYPAVQWNPILIHRVTSIVDTVVPPLPEMREKS